MTLVTIINAANFLRKHAPYPDSVPLNKYSYSFVTCKTIDYQTTQYRVIL